MWIAKESDGKTYIFTEEPLRIQNGKDVCWITGSSFGIEFSSQAEVVKGLTTENAVEVDVIIKRKVE